MTDVHPQIGYGPAWLLSDDPPVFLTGITYDQSLGIAEAFGQRYGSSAAGFIVFPTWSLESRAGRADEIAGRLAAHGERFPDHRFRYITNTAKEADLLRSAGVPATFLNKNATVSEYIFRPLPGTAVEFDAVYNARFVPEKRHELAAAIPRVGYITYVDEVSVGRAQFLRHSSMALRRNRDHALLNRRRGGSVVQMGKDDVNAALARASVGLILSEVEGSSYASMEYLLAGLPVVSTPSIGGRDVYFDPEHCIVCEPDPAAIRDAVAELTARNLPREVVRERVLARIEPERRRLLALADEIIVELGGVGRYGDGGWPFTDTSGITWRTYERHFAELDAHRQRAALCRELGLATDALAGVQLEAQELRPIVAAIQKRPGCALLLFGCGNDSPFWEALNRGGTTAILEDNSRWADAVRTKLSAATIHSVSYGTCAVDGLSLLDHPDRLAMELPPAIADRCWDVILVDGPAGYADDKPGRMKAIYAASNLVAPGGDVFVHDCERPVEKAYAERYLGNDRLVIEVRGRALLRGYHFP